MSDKTGIEWTDATWNPTTGCDQVSPGCDNCYALTMAKRLKAMGSPRYQRDGDPATSGPGFGLTMHPDALDQPLRWTKPRRIFVNSMSDLFHKDVTDDFIAKVWAVMALTQKHTFQVLTKRHARIRSLLDSRDFWIRVGLHMSEIVGARTQVDHMYALPNVWVGVSVENQQWADIRVPALLGTPAAVRFLSCEPLLGPVDLAKSIEPNFARGGWKDLSRLHWVIAGGESGPGSRPMHPDWARSLRDQCVDVGIAFHFKQWGEWRYAQEFDDHSIELRAQQEGWWEKWPNASAHSVWPDGRHSNTDIPEPGLTATMQKVGKHDAGRELDGRTWDEYPEQVSA